MEEEIDFFEFAEMMQKYEQALEGVNFALEQKQGDQEGEDIWQLDIDGETIFFQNLDEVKVHLDKLVASRN
jgi:MFS superfamily sulfate permease-like transporter